MPYFWKYSKDYDWDCYAWSFPTCIAKSMDLLSKIGRKVRTAWLKITGQADKTRLI